MRCRARGRSDLIAFANLPVERLESGAFHWVADNGAVVQLDESMGGCQTECGFPGGFLDVDQLELVFGAANRPSGCADQPRMPSTHSTPATPSTMRFSAVIVPVLSKQQTSTRPANGIRKGSVQKIAVAILSDKRTNCQRRDGLTVF